MNKILVLTGVTGKKSGGSLAKHIGENIRIIKQMFPDGIRAVVRESSDTKELDKRIPDIEKVTCKLTEVSELKEAFKEADTVVHTAGIHWSKEVA